VQLVAEKFVAGAVQLDQLSVQERAATSKSEEVFSLYELFCTKMRQ